MSAGDHCWATLFHQFLTFEESYDGQSFKFYFCGNTTFCILEDLDDQYKNGGGGGGHLIN